MGITKMRFYFLVVLLAGISVLWADMAYAQSSRELNNRINRLENELNTLNRAVFRNDRAGAPVAAGTNAAGAELRIQQLEVELRNMNGRLEEQSFQIRQLKSQLEKATADMNIRLQDVESGNRGTSSATTGNATSTTTPYTARTLTRAKPPEPKPEAIQPSTGSLGSIPAPAPANNLTAVNVDTAAASYENAFAKLKSSNYEGAEGAFKAFLDQYPDHVLTPNARYWYGETFYVRGDYERSARIFAEAYQKDPQGGKAADNLLKLGMSLSGMGSTDDACVALSQLSNDPPPGSSPALRRAQQEMSRLGCS